ncbi:MAG: carotenoid biosynthesis protein [Bryobacteraceae bacterium]|nr:carotenoid biosynthesis protein [Bryobacteraceae bacterium]
MPKRLLRVTLWSSYAVLWFGGVAVYWTDATPPGAHWGATAFLATAALLMLLYAPGARAWLAAVAVAGWIIELAGTTTGLPFGPYSYTSRLQPQLAGVPLAMAAAWLVLIGYIKSFEAAVPGPLALRPAAGGLWMVFIDLAIEPVAAGFLDFWRWQAHGWYFGVPGLNFLGWWSVSTAMLAAGRHAPPPLPRARWVGLSIIAFFGLLGAIARHPAPPLAASVLAALHCIASRRVSLGYDKPAVKL